MAKAICSIDDCDKTAVARGWCPAHWNRWRTHGDPRADVPLRPSAIDHADGTRTCGKCAERKSIEEFDRVATARRGRRSTCKRCRAQDMKAWYASNRDQLLAKKDDRHRANPEARRAADRKRNRKPERIEAHAERVAVRRSRLAGGRVDAGVTRANLRKQYGDDCFYCGSPMSFERLRQGDSRPPNLATIEHVHPVALGGTHTWDNVVLACWSCNCSKRHSPLAEWSPRAS